MFIAHLPAAYICGTTLQRVFGATGFSTAVLVGAALAGGIAPDLDLFYFYLVDQRQTPHHLYWSHFPVLWLGLTALSALWYRLAASKRLPALLCVFGINGLLHVLLDTVVGDIRWLAPASLEPFSLFTVPALYKPWWLNFILHWSFLFELLVLAWAGLLYRQRARANAPASSV